VNWAGWYILCVLAFDWISNGSILVIDIGGASSAVDWLVMLLLELPLGVVYGMNQYATY